MDQIISLAILGSSDLGFDLVDRHTLGASQCPNCRGRTTYTAPRPQWISRRLGKDVGFTCDRFDLVSSRFVAWIEQEEIAGAILTQVGKDSFFLDAVEIEMDEKGSGLVRGPKVCPVCGLEDYAVFRSLDGGDGVRPPIQVHWPFGNSLVIARTRQLVGSVPFQFPCFACPTSVMASWKKHGIKCRRPDRAIGIPIEGRKAPRSVVVYRALAGALPATGASDGAKALDPLKALLSHRSPAFICRNADGRQPSGPIRIRHSAQPPASQSEMALGQSMLSGKSAGILRLFAAYNGVRLYEEPLHDQPGIWLAPIHDWPALTTQCRERLPPAGAVDGFKSTSKFVVFGEIVSAGSFLVVMTAGKQAGQVKLVMPTEWSVSVFAESLGELISQLCDDPVSLFDQSLGCLLRYSDGIRHGEYFPVKYLSDSEDAEPSASLPAPVP